MKSIFFGFLFCVVLMVGCLHPAPPDRESASPQDPGQVPEKKPHPSSPPWSDLKQHTFADIPTPMMTPHVSRDGRWLVYSARVDGYPGYQIFAKPVDSVAVTQLTFNEANNLYPRISPDGKHVVFASDKEGNWDIYVLAIQNPLTVMQMTLSRVHEIEPGWSPDGRKIVCSSQAPQGEREIKIIDLHTRAITILGTGASPVWGPSRTHSEGLIAFEMGRTGNDRRVVITTPDGAEVKDIVLPQPEGYPEHPVWSPNGVWLGYTWRNVTSGKREFWMVRADGSDRLKMLDDPEPADGAAWGGDRIFFLVKNDVQNVHSIKPYSLDLLEE